MTSFGLVNWLKKWLSKAYSWLKIILTDAETGNTIEITGSNISQISDLGNSNNIVINNKTINIV